MGGDVMADPLPENIEGEKIVTHRFDHGIDWKVNVSHVILAAILVGLVLWLKPWNHPNSEDNSGESGGVATR